MDHLLCVSPLLLSSTTIQNHGSSLSGLVSDDFIDDISILFIMKTNHGIQVSYYLHFFFVEDIQVSEMVADKGKKPDIGEKIVEDNTEQIMSLFYPLQSCRRSKMNLKRIADAIKSSVMIKLFVCVIHHQVEGIEEILKPSPSESDGSSIELPAKGEENKSRNCASNKKQDDWSWSKEAIGEKVYNTRRSTRLTAKKSAEPSAMERERSESMKIDSRGFGSTRSREKCGLRWGMSLDGEQWPYCGYWTSMER
ncbi:hypothetical protein Ccrd_007978 [Cynara cardunculus var. scolymus]|uniref:Uncharacterized protein n=1 Tax=Cynara cardunculus var. scolymus TaxID=59895 RepID=A0A103XG78_CYNCS|nr:hypothetical protein Ccrd_007978 [Cynara cardunculus var. scolymus]